MGWLVAIIAKLTFLLLRLLFALARALALPAGPACRPPGGASGDVRRPEKLTGLKTRALQTRL
jgi:hypothetical protein